VKDYNSQQWKFPCACTSFRWQYGELAIQMTDSYVRSSHKLGYV